MAIQQWYLLVAQQANELYLTDPPDNWLLCCSQDLWRHSVSAQATLAGHFLPPVLWQFKHYRRRDAVQRQHQPARVQLEHTNSISQICPCQWRQSLGDDISLAVQPPPSIHLSICHSAHKMPTKQSGSPPIKPCSPMESTDRVYYFWQRAAILISVDFTVLWLDCGPFENVRSRTRMKRKEYS